MKNVTVALMILLISACASTQAITEPVSVIEAFYEALNDGDLDTAISFVADDARFIIDILYVGKAEIRDFYREDLDVGSYYELSDLRADGETVSWTEKGTIGSVTYDDPYEAVVQEGKIVSFTQG